METEKPKLKPCPFCGPGENGELTEICIYCTGGWWSVNCIDCGAQKGFAKDETDAVTKWNQRPADTVKEQLAEALECHRDSYLIAHELEHPEREVLRDKWIEEYADAWHNSRFQHMGDAERLRYIAELLSAKALAAYQEEQAP